LTQEIAGFGRGGVVGGGWVRTHPLILVFQWLAQC
jgi:hypothetical protein